MAFEAFWGFTVRPVSGPNGGYVFILGSIQVDTRSIIKFDKNSFTS
jgi:hypothetical protein